MDRVEQREAIARIIDPTCFQIDPPRLKDSEGKQAGREYALAKADAILDHLARVEGGGEACAHCGARAPASELATVSKDKIHPYRVACKSCGCGTAHHGTFKAAWTAWTRRPALASSTVSAGESSPEYVTQTPDSEQAPI